LGNRQGDGVLVGRCVGSAGRVSTGNLGSYPVRRTTLAGRKKDLGNHPFRPQLLDIVDMTAPARVMGADRRSKVEAAWARSATFFGLEVHTEGDEV